MHVDRHFFFGRSLSLLILSIITKKKKFVRDVGSFNYFAFTIHMGSNCYINTGVRVFKGAFIIFHFCKAFDSIRREKMLQILLAYGIPPLIVNAIGLMYKNTTARVKSPDGDTDFFPILAGVLQGDTLVPFLFIVTLDYAMRKAMNNAEHLGFTLEQRQRKRYPARTLTDTDFADDIALLSDNIADAEVLLHKVESAAKEIGLTINSQKTEYMSFNNPQGNLVDTSGAPLSQVTDFQYLGSWVESTKKDVEVCIAKAWAACSKLNNVWQSDLSKDLKINLFRAAVESVLLYGSESWTMTDTLSKRIDGTYIQGSSGPHCFMETTSYE